MTRKAVSVNWGIVGTGTVTRQFCLQLRKVKDAAIQHVSGTDNNKASLFARDFHAPNCSADIHDLLADELVDIVYVSSPTRFHAEHAMATLTASKHLVCEKPFVTDAKIFEEICELSKERQLFCMEGMWMRFNPLIQEARKVVMSNEIGDIKYIEIEIGYPKSKRRLKDPSRGPIWDFAVYGLSLIQYLVGRPDQVHSVSVTPKNCCSPGTISVVLGKGDTVSTLTSSVEIGLSNRAKIVGTQGILELGPQFFCPEFLRCNKPIFPRSAWRDLAAKLERRLFGEQSLESGHQLTTSIEQGFYFQAEHATKAILRGSKESSIQPLKDTLEVIELAQALYPDMME